MNNHHDTTRCRLQRWASGRPCWQPEVRSADVDTAAAKAKAETTRRPAHQPGPGRAAGMDRRARQHPGPPAFPTRDRTAALPRRDRAQARCPRRYRGDNLPQPEAKNLHLRVLRHSCAMALLRAGVDTTVIALWLGHADIRSTQAYLHADVTIKERALALTTSASVKPGRYKPPDAVLAFLEGL
jgi:integrase